MNAHRIYPLNEQALTIEFGNEINPFLNNQVMALHHALKEESFTGFIESVPAYTTLTLYYDLLLVNNTKGPGFQTASQFVESLIRDKLSMLALSKSADLPVLEVPVCYDLSMAPDLPWVAEYCRLSIPEVISLHTNEIYRVYMIGFIPGFPYMGMLPPALEVPRKLRPALSVPAGSVSLAGRQTGIYPFTIPGGWQVIGRTTLKLFDVKRDPCCALEVGQLIKFVPVSLEEFKHQSNI